MRGSRSLAKSGVTGRCMTPVATTTFSASKRRSPAVSDESVSVARQLVDAHAGLDGQLEALRVRLQVVRHLVPAREREPGRRELHPRQGVELRGASRAAAKASAPARGRPRAAPASRMTNDRPRFARWYPVARPAWPPPTITVSYLSACIGPPSVVSTTVGRTRHARASSGSTNSSLAAVVISDHAGVRRGGARTRTRPPRPATRRRASRRCSARGGPPCAR